MNEADIARRVARIADRAAVPIEPQELRRAAIAELTQEENTETKICSITPDGFTMYEPIEAKSAAYLAEPLQAQLAALRAEVERLREALESALHDLVTSDGLYACDNEAGHSLFRLEQKSIAAARAALEGQE